jgi:glycosyltransferase involved in cell wall biosynthesis
LYKPYSRGGAEVVFLNIINGLKAAGHEVLVITIKPFEGLSSLWADNPPPPFIKGELEIPPTPPFDKTQGRFNKGAASEEIVFGFPPIKGGEGGVYRFFPLNIFSFINIGWHNIFVRLIWHKLDIFNLHSYFVIRNILRKEKPDVVMTHNLKGIGYLVPWAIKQSKIKWVHTVHDVQLVEPSGINIPLAPFAKGERINHHLALTKRLYWKICRWLFDSPDVVISPSKWLMDFYSEKGFFRNSRKMVMPNPIVSLQQFTPVTSHQSLVTFLYLGQIEEHKGILFFINTFKDLLKYQMPDAKCQLLIAGNGSKLEEIKKITADEPRIKILGLVPHEKISEIIVRADFVIVPSLCYENSPSAIYESLSFGVPVIAAKIGGVAELVKDGVNGFTFEAGDKEDLLRIIKMCLENKDGLERMKVEALKSVQDFGVDKYIERLIEI